MKPANSKSPGFALMSCDKAPSARR
jgi:hypothetical protein